jgi:hypothetical protein
MGRLGKVLDRLLPGTRMRDPVRGHAEVVSCSAYHGEGIKQLCTMQLVIHGEGIRPIAQEHHLLVHRYKWPAPGMALPVTVDRADPSKMYVEWDEVQDSRERDVQAAEALAAKMRGER